MDKKMADRVLFPILQERVISCTTRSVQALYLGQSGIMFGRCTGRCLAASQGAVAGTPHTNVVSDAETPSSQTLPKEAA